MPTPKSAPNPPVCEDAAADVESLPRRAEQEAQAGSGKGAEVTGTSMISAFLSLSPWV